MPSKSSREESVPPEVLLSLLHEAGRPTIYMSEGFGPTPTRGPGDEPEHVRALVCPREPFEAVQAASSRWIAAAEACAAGPQSIVDAAEVADPPASSRWAALAPEPRAALLIRGVEELLALRPALLLFRLTPKHGAHVLKSMREGTATGESVTGDAVLLDHLVFAALTHWLLREPREALVVGASSGSGWSVQPGFPRHATVWRKGLACAPVRHVGGLMFAELSELVLRSALARRTGAAPPASAPAIVAALRAAEAAVAPSVVDLLAEGDRQAGRPVN